MLFVGAVVRGDQGSRALGGGLWLFGYRDDTCFRDGDGWEAASSGNGDGALIMTAPDRVTFVSWGQAAEGAVAVKFHVGAGEQVVPIQDGFLRPVIKAGARAELEGHCISWWLDAEIVGMA